ncbi:cobalt-zinc-cadmium efflux system protein [Mesocricetibacter intestinalis]|uniref:Cobalt-zinc-cadmium efflux system protein n=1 Tax=Mesocricetibacter intestinalis TaxID=1521930 RepID=A0A4R6VLE3_9PAST|nr:cation diffusion facilitator family transporter [Mesocricetibacter intestinalis]TDQ59630.1 cobalt-zinc-cadmium efflux system protein [Mesocricetibacter intestinalis]
MASHRHHGGHSHVHSRNKSVLTISLAIIFAYMLVEIIGGLLTGSLALLSDAGHMFSDGVAIGLSLLALGLGERAACARNTYGYKRAEILAAALNGLTLILIALIILIEALQRFFHPPQIATTGMLIVSFIGLIVNIVIAVYMQRNGDMQHSMNMKSAYLHVLGDLLGSVGAIAAALLMIFFDWRWADPLISLLVALLIAKGGYAVLKGALPILMEGAPADIDQHKLTRNMLQTPGVEAIHDLHIWTLSGEGHFLSAHVVVDGELTVAESGEIMASLTAALQRQGIVHCTLQMEGKDHRHSESLYCTACIGGEPEEHKDCGAHHH